MKTLIYNERLNLRLTRDERERLAEVARHQERTMSQQVRLAVRWFLAAQGAALDDTPVAREVRK